jgi:hypothetical protein
MLPQPTWGRSVRVQMESLRTVLRPEALHGIARHSPRSWNLGQNPPVRTAEAQLAAGFSFELIALLVNGAVMTATEQREIRQRGGAALGPVTDVMSLAKTNAAPWEAAAAVSVLDRAS